MEETNNEIKEVSSDAPQSQPQEEEDNIQAPSPVEETISLSFKEVEVRYPHLHLKDWPFQTVPDERFTRIWADRRTVLEDVYQVMNNLSRRRTSTINLLWAWFGAGKSRTLKHMAHLCKNKFKMLLPVYTEYPKTVKSFLDLYVYFVSELGLDLICDIGRGVLTDKNSKEIKKKLRGLSSDFVRSVELLEEDEVLARRWIMGEKVPKPTLSKHGIGKRIETSDDAVKAIACIVKMLELSGTCTRIVWMIDEFQRVGSEKKNVLEDINTGLHSVYNACPNSFSIFLSFSVREKRNIFSNLSKELIDRIGIQKIIEIPKMSSQDAFSFISDVLFEFRAGEDPSIGTFYPFDEDAVQYIISLIESSSEIKPRTLMQYFSAVLEAAEAKILRGEMKVINMEFAKKLLSNYDLFLSFQKESLHDKG